MVATFREPFDLLAQTATNSAQLGTSEKFKSAKNEIWLGNLDPKHPQLKANNFNKRM